MVQNQILLAIDQGTTSSRAMLVNSSLKVLASHSIEFKQIYPKPGWVEHDLNDIWNSTVKAIQGALKKCGMAGKKSRLSEIVAIGITNQRETSGFWSRKTGKPLANAVVWQDRRTADYCAELKTQGLEKDIQGRSGLLLDPYFSASKVHWALKNNPALAKAAENGDAAFGTIDTFLVYKLTGGLSHVTEPSNASRTMLYNIGTFSWDSELLRIFGVPRSILPEVKDSNAKFGVTKKIPGLPDGIPIHGMLGDQQAALLGQACTEIGTAKCTYGTGSFILLNTGAEIKRSKHKLLSTVAWKFGNNKTYALEGGAFTAGASVQWIRDGLKMIKKSSDIEKLAKKVPNSDGVIFVPGFVGIGAPHWLPNARAAFFGISRGTTQAHLARAVLDGIALMNLDILKAMEQDMGGRLKSLNVDGGACANNLLMQYQSDILGTKLIRPKIIETTVMGAIFAAGLGVGVWSSLESIHQSWKKDREFNPEMKSEDRNTIVKNWNEVIQRLK